MSAMLRPVGSLAVAIAACAVLTACSGRSWGGADAASDARYVSTRGALLDAELQEIGKLALRQGGETMSVASDGRIVSSSSIGATESLDCCGPNMQSLFITDLDGREPEPLLPGEIGVADFAADWSPGGDEVVFARRAAPVYTDDGIEHRDVVQGLYVYTLGESAPRLLVEGDYTRVEWSPEGALIAASEATTDPAGVTQYVLRVFDAHTGRSVRSTPVEGFRFAWAPSADGLVIEVGAAEHGTAVGIYDIEADRVEVVPNTGTLETFVWVWGPDGPIIELNRANGASLLARVDPRSLSLVGIHRCPDGAHCNRPVEVLPS